MTFRQGGHVIEESPRHAAAVVVGAGGVIPLPGTELRRLGIEIGGVLEIESTADGLLIRPRRVDQPHQPAPAPRPAPIPQPTRAPRAAAPVDASIWSAARKAAFLINTACSGEDFAQASAEVRRMGIDPREIWSDRPEAA